jgi:uncharacterized protein YcfJ
MKMSIASISKMASLFSTASLVVFLSGSAYAQSVAYNKTAKVIGVTPKYEVITQQTPSRVCKILEVPVYRNTTSQGGDSIGSFVIGGTIGSVIGNTVSDASGAGTIGAIIGGALANEHQKNHKTTTTQEIVGYRQVDQCETQYSTERIERFKYNLVLASFEGMRFEYTTREDVSVGDLVPVKVTLSK